ncbi:MAG: hypothetical protein JWN98_2681 [Abditibacteriota bacterium]|nr:hypothetical protein [Abditibacteriota bacterium]
MEASSRAIVIDAQAFGDENATSIGGVLWGGASEDLNCTLLSWSRGGGVALHRNTEVDVVMVVIEGSGEVVVDGEHFKLEAPQALLVPKGCERAIQSTSERFTYLSVHKKRRGLMPS